MLPGETLSDIATVRRDPARGLETVNWDMQPGDCLLHHCVTVHEPPATQAARGSAGRARCSAPPRGTHSCG